MNKIHLCDKCPSCKAFEWIYISDTFCCRCCCCWRRRCVLMQSFLISFIFFCVCHFVKMFVMHTFAQNIVFAYTCVLQHMSASYIRVFFSLAFELLYVPDCYHYYVKKKVVFLILLALLSMHNRVMNSKKRKKKKRGACEPWMCEMSTMAKLPYSFPNFFV